MIKKYDFQINEKSYLQIGGLVKEYIESNDIEDIIQIVKNNKNICYLGNTSNILFSFSYSPKIYVKFLGNNIFFRSNYVVVESGMNLSLFVRMIEEKNCEVFSTLGLIPGKIGGSIVNNASAYGRQISDFLLFLVCIDETGKFRVIKKEEIVFREHYSSLKENNFFIYKAFFKIESVRYDFFERKQYYMTRKLKSQDYLMKSLGSTFKNINFLPIGKIINKNKNSFDFFTSCYFSSINGNFLINKCEKSHENITKLIESACLLLYNKLGYLLELEIETKR